MLNANKKASITALLLSAVLLLGACGTAGTPASNAEPSTAPTNESSAAADPSTEASSAPAASGDRVNLSYGYFSTTDPRDESYWPTNYITEMEKQLNINYEPVIYDQDTLNLALASGDLPDLLQVNTKQAKTILDASLAVAFDDYLATIGTNIDSFETRNEIIRKFLSNGDGKLYFHTPNTGIENMTGGTELWNGYIVRWDLYKAIGAPEMKTDDDYINVLKQMRDVHPGVEDGSKVYGIGVHNDWGLWGWNMGQFANLGYQNSDSWAYATSYVDNSIVSNYLDTEKGPFWASMSFYNKLYLEDLLDPDSFTMKEEEVQEKAGKGQYLGGYCTWMLGRLYKNESDKDPSTNIGYMAVPAEGQGGWYGGNSVAGWGDKLTCITTSARNIEKAIEFVDWQDTADAARLHYAGVEGEAWEYVDGVPTMKPEILAMRAQGTERDEWKKLGINSQSNVIGYSEFGVHPDGYYFGLFDDIEVKKQTLTSIQKDFSEFYGIDYPAQLHYNMLQESKVFNQQNSLITGINMGIVDIPSDISRIDSKVDEIATKAIPVLVQAKTQEEFLQAQEKFLQDIKEAGAEEAWAWWQETWNAAKETVEAAAK